MPNELEIGYEYEFDVDMTCNKCVNKIETLLGPRFSITKVLLALIMKPRSDPPPFIKSHEIDLENKKVFIKTEFPVNGEELKECLEAVLPRKKINLCKLPQVKEVFPIPEGFKIPKEETNYFGRWRINAIYCFALWLVNSYFVFSPMMWLVIGLTTLGVMVITGGEFYATTWDDLKNNRSPSMYHLITLGTLSAWVYSMMLVFLSRYSMGTSLDYQFFPISMILMIINGGQGVRQKVEKKSSEQLEKETKNLEDRQPKKAWRLKSEVSLNLNTSSDINCDWIDHEELNKNDYVFVKAREPFPADGIIINNVLSAFKIRDDVFSGDVLIPKKRGEKVFAGTCNGNVPVWIQVTCKSKENELAKLIKMQKEARFLNTPLPVLIDTISKIFVPAIITIAAISFLGWSFLSNNPHMAWISALSVLISSCPCALGLSKITLSIGVSELFKRKIIVGKDFVMENLAKIATLFVDKTGTLTTPHVTDEEFLPDFDENDKKLIMTAIAELESESKKKTHPIAQALIGHAQSKQNRVLSVGKIDLDDDGAKTQGISGSITIGGKEYELAVGSYDYMDNKKYKDGKKYIIPKSLKEKEAKFLQSGKTVSYIAIGNECKGIVAFEHTLRPEVLETIGRLKKLGITVIILTGDRRKPTKKTAEYLGIEFHSDLKPHDKQSFVSNGKEAAEKNGKTVAMFGDGVNDILALSAANTSMAAGSWTDTSKDCHLTVQDLSSLPDAITIACETERNYKQNLLVALFYNTFALTLATGLLYPKIFLTPIYASILMSLPSLSILINANKVRLEIAQKLSANVESKSEIEGSLSRWNRLKNAISANKFLATILSLMESSSETSEERSEENQNENNAQDDIAESSTLDDPMIFSRTKEEEKEEDTTPTQTRRISNSI